jgi:hypothetical protein
MDIEALIDGKVNPALEPEPVAAIAEPAVVEEPSAPEPQPEPAPEPAAKEDDQRTVPLATLLDVRDERNELKRRLAEMEARQAPPSEPAQMPDPTDDPQGYASWLDSRVQQAEVATRFQTSDLIAKQQHGAEVVEAAGAWAMERAKTDPVFASAYMREAHPIDWIVRQHKRDGLLSQIGDRSLDDFVKEYVAQNGEKLGLTAPNAAVVIPAPAGAQQAPKPASPPQSLASAPSRGGAVKDIPTGPMAALEAVFSR